MSETVDENADDAGDPHHKAVVQRAHRRWAKCNKWETAARTNWLNDLKFDAGDAYNNYQWPVDISSSRGDKPTLTVNETRQHNLHIINEAKQNKASVKYRPVGDEATAEAAEVAEGIYRHIANISNAQMAQGVAIGFQVRAGLGFTWITSDYVTQDSFDQDIYIRSAPNPLCVILDCDSTEPDGSDARYGFIFADRPRDEVEEEHPEMKGRGLPTTNAVDGDNGGWLRADHIREANYYEVTEEKDELLGNSEGTTVLRSAATPGLIKNWEAEEKTKGGKLLRRPIVRKAVRRYKILGDLVVEDEPVPGTSVPIIPWVGEVTIIDQVMDRKGHTRSMISAQQMENYNWSASVEFGALQSKTPYLIPVAAIGDYIEMWRTANTVNHSFLPWVHRDEEGKEIPKPERQTAPGSAPVFMEGVQLARQFMMTASGQYEAEMGAPGNERSAVAINARQRQGEPATYHFIDNQALAIRRQGQIILEWMREIYDTPRVIKIIGEDGSETHIQIDPAAEKAHQEAVEGVAAIFNPNIGTYEVVSDVGPDYASQRQEAFNAIVQILTQAPELINKIGDLLFQVADFPLADKIAERLKPGMAPEAQAALDALQGQLQKAEGAGANLQRLLGEAMQALTEERLKVRAKDSDNTIDAFNADTKRLDVVKDMLPLDPVEMQRLIHSAVQQALQDNLGPIVGQLMQASTVDTSADGPPGATGAIPASVPDVGRQAATPGGM